MSSLLRHKSNKDNAFKPTQCNDIMRISNSGCFITDGPQDMHCSICHKTVKRADVARKIAQPGSNIPELHHDGCSPSGYVIKDTPRQEDNSAKPKHSEYASLDRRKNSLDNWCDEYRPSSEIMAKAGFAYLESCETVSCFFLRLWGRSVVLRLKPL
ncbi:MAG: hypothetical protein KAG53_12295 [Endozoicomonadaceae bacterium]|nr:hypothetical protein [Endozoicomonadaceae bacterium]